MSKNDRTLCLMFLALCGSQLLATCAFAADKALDASQLGQGPVVLTEYFAVLEDPSQTLTLNDLQKADVAAHFNTDSPIAEALNFSYTHSAYWLRLILRNPSNSPLERMLEINYARLANVQFHQPGADGTYRSLITGNVMPFATRPYQNRNLVFPVILPAHSSQVYYLRLQSSAPLFVPVRLWEPQAFHVYERNDYLGQGWYFGMATAMILFNLLLFIALKEVIYLLYVIFNICTVSALAAQNGLAKEFLWPDTSLWSNISTAVGYSLMVATLLLFMRHMLNTRIVIPKTDRLLKILVGIHLLTPIGFAVSYPAIAKYVTLLWGATATLTLCIGLYCAFKRQRSAGFFVAAFVIFYLGTIMGALRGLGLLPTNVITVNGLQFGSGMEMLLLALALADRFNVIRREKEKAQKEALDAQQLLVANLKSSEHVLEERVAERTLELEMLNRKLEALSATDGLTGISNRRHFDEVLDNEWRRAFRTGQPLTVAILDVDWFKKYNDHYGHQAGDECLRSIARFLVSAFCRTGDMVARYGGEEFVFIAPATDAVIALNMARGVCEKLQELAMPHEMSGFECVTASIGVATVVPREGLAPNMLVKAADEALYLAKEQGRNRAVLHHWAAAEVSLQAC